MIGEKESKHEGTQDKQQKKAISHNSSSHDVTNA